MEEPAWKILHRKKLIERNYRHGMSGTPTYSSWQAMVNRCSNKKCDKFAYYGGKGIRVCTRWLKFENFYKDMGKKPKGTSLDRIDLSGNYEPSNCRWATEIEQKNNTSRTLFLTINGTTRSFSNWCRLTGINYYMAYNRIVRWGRDPKETFGL